MRIAFLFFIVWSFSLFAKNDFFDPQTSKNIGETYFDPIKPQLVTHSQQVSYLPKVNVVTGEYIEEETDLVVAGCEPISFRRFYGHFSPPDYRWGCWSINPEASIVANFDWDKIPLFAAVGEREGSIVSFQGRHKNVPSPQEVFKRTGLKSVDRFLIGGSAIYTNTFRGDIGADTDPRNTYIYFWKCRGDKADRFAWNGIVQDGSGRIREFDSNLHEWLKDKSIMLSLHAYEALAPPINWTPYQLRVRRELLPDGNIIRYDYCRWREDKHFPRPFLLYSIKAYNNDESKLLGEISIDYTKYSWPYKQTVKHTVSGTPIKYLENVEEVLKFTVSGSDGRSATFQNSKTDKPGINVLLQNAQTPEGSIAYDYQGTYLTTIDRGNGRVFKTQYEPETYRVIAQFAPVGPNDAMEAVARFSYQDHCTIALDAEGNRTYYRFDDHKRITAIEKYQTDGSFFSVERSLWDENSRLSCKISEDGKGRIFRKMLYKYDPKGNVIEENIQSLNGSYTIYRTYHSDDRFNLKISEEDGRKKVCYTYKPGTNLITSELFYENNQIRKRNFYFYNDFAVRIKTIVDDGKSENPNDLKYVTYRQITEVKPIDPKNAKCCVGLPEEILEKTIDSYGNEILLKKVKYAYHRSGKIAREDHFDANDKYCFSIINEYYPNDHLKSSIDAFGNKTFYEYDANLNLILVTGPRKDQRKEIAYDKANRPTVIKEWQTDGSILTIQKRYDKLGRMIAEIDECGNQTNYRYDALSKLTEILYPDCTLEKKEYDIFGNVVREIDPKGYETRKTYDFRNQPTHIYYADDTEEYFTYNSNGTLASKIDRNGTKTIYTYDVFDHPIQIEIYSPSGALLKKTSASYTPFAQLSFTNAEGIKTDYVYDFAGRKIAEKTKDREIRYAYDSLSRLTKTQKGDTVYVEEFDALNRPIERRTETLDGTIVFQERYAYDEIGNRTHLITSQGATETLFNTRSLPIQIKDALGNKTLIASSYQGQLVKITTDPRGAQAVSIRDSHGREVISLKKDFRGDLIQRTQKQYDPNDNVIKTIETVYEGTTPIKDIINEWVYGPNNRLERLVESGQKETIYTYDEKGRLKTQINPDKTELHYLYDDLGRLSRFSSKDFDYHYCYDKNDRIINVEDRIAHISTVRDYDDYGNLIKEILGSGLAIQNQYDPFGQKILLSLPNHENITYDYIGQQLSRVCYKGNTTKYLSRNLEGKPTKILLPQSLGTSSIEWDALSRWKHFSSPYFSASYDHYDPVGNLTKYTYKDALGTKKEEYAYDYLNQLVAENEHTFLHDSLYNRRFKDRIEYICNNLCQITHDSNGNYSYDANGNLISAGNSRFEYDSQNRLIKVIKNDLRVEYVYDAFNRRLSKKILENNKSTKIFHYLWDGQNEIGAILENKTVELRILGEGLGAEIGAAVLFELNGRLYVPIHDHRGALVTLIDLSTTSSQETYRYTAFGEELSDGHLSPWRFSSKRVDPETGWIYFGRRYYSPPLGRWTTPDPQGFQDGPNLYAYVYNCPLASFDLYGLKTYLSNQFAEPHYSDYSYSLLRRTGYVSPYFGGFETGFRNRSFSYDTSILGMRPFPRGGIGFTNGIGNTTSDSIKSALMLSRMAGNRAVNSVYNASHGKLLDLAECYMGYKGTLTNPAILLQEQWNNFFTHASSNEIYLQTCHSQGAIHTRNALMEYEKELRNRIRVVAIAPAAYISEDYCHSVVHYVAKPHRDLIPWIDIKGRRDSKDTIRVLQSHPFAPWHDHSFNSPTYQVPLQFEIRQYYKLLGE